jgi:hypothetical protein
VFVSWDMVGKVYVGFVSCTFTVLFVVGVALDVGSRVVELGGVIWSDMIGFGFVVICTGGGLEIE